MKFWIFGVVIGGMIFNPACAQCACEDRYASQVIISSDFAVETPSGPVAETLPDAISALGSRSGPLLGADFTYLAGGVLILVHSGTCESAQEFSIQMLSEQLGKETIQRMRGLVLHCNTIVLDGPKS